MMRSLASMRLGLLFILWSVCAFGEIRLEFGPAQALNTNAGTDEGDDLEPDIVWLGGQDWIAVWRSSESFGGTLGPDADILVARSADGGVSWSTPEAMTVDAASDTAWETQPSVAISDSGTLVVVWTFREGFGPCGIYHARSADAGATWSAPAVLHMTQRNNNFPRLAGGSFSVWNAAWISMDLFSAGIFTSVFTARSADDGQTWSESVRLTAVQYEMSPQEVSPDIASDPAGNWVAVWSLNDSFFSFSIQSVRSSDGGATWDEPRPVNLGFQGRRLSPRLANDGAGLWICAWEFHRFDEPPPTRHFRRLLIASSRDAGFTWSSPLTLYEDPGFSDDPLPGLHPKIATDGAGMWVVTWDFGDVLFSTDEGNSWTKVENISPGANSEIAADGNGRWLLVWDEEDPGGPLGDDADIMFALGEVRTSAMPHWAIYE